MIKHFIEDKFYVMSLPGEQWSDYEGPFDTSNEALGHIRLFVNEQHTHSPEMLHMVVVHFKNNQTDLTRSPDGQILNGAYCLDH